MQAAAAIIPAWEMAGALFVPHYAAAQTAGPPGPRPVKFITSLPTLTVAVPFTMLARHLDRAHGIAVETRYAGRANNIMIDAVLSGDAEFGSPGHRPRYRPSERAPISESSPRSRTTRWRR